MRTLVFSQAGQVPATSAADTIAVMKSLVAAADSLLSSSAWDSALATYQSAGQLGATTVGPAIDAETGGKSKPETQQAWGINVQLAMIVADGRPDAPYQAKALVSQMTSLYAKARGGGLLANPWFKLAAGFVLVVLGISVFRIERV